MYERITVLKNEDGHLEVQECAGEWLVHLSLNKWSAQKYKEYLVVFDALLLELRDEGVLRVFAIVENDPKLIKFEKMFGFKVLFEKDGAVVMGRSTEV